MTDETNYEHRGAAPWNRAAESAEREPMSDAEIAERAETIAAGRERDDSIRARLHAAQRRADELQREITFARQALMIGAETDLVSTIEEQIEETAKAKAERDDLKEQNQDLFIRLQAANEAIRERDHELGELTEQLTAGGAPPASAQLVGRDVWLTTVPRGADEPYNFRSEAKVLRVDATGVLVTFITWSPWVRDTFTGQHDDDGEEIWTFKPRVRTDRGILFYPWSQVQSIEQIDDRTPAELADEGATR